MHRPGPERRRVARANTVCAMFAREISLRLQTLLIVVGLAFAAGALLMPRAAGSHATPRTVRGTITQVSGDATRFTFDPDDGGATSYSAQAALRWENRKGSLQQGSRPACMRPGSPPRQAELSVVDVGTQDKSEPVVVKIRCLD
ncbi:MAG: hypothetical protein QOJ50_3773 [Cryptosporangiaceae bacterium]|nr:hypothetical protein [Cryptosporangiaceae bacterium]